MGIVTDGLVGYWHYAQGVNGTTWQNIAPATVGQYNGTLNGGVSIVSDGLSFDGSTGYVDIGSFNPINGLSTFTIQILSTSSAVSATRYMVGLFSDSNNRFGFGYASYKPIFAQFLGGAVKNLSSSTIINTDTLLSITVSSSGRKIWVNGSSDISDTYTLSLPQINDFIIGAYSSGIGLASGYFQGKIRAVRIYNRALTQAEITQNYNVANNDTGLSSGSTGTAYTANVSDSITQDDIITINKFSTYLQILNDSVGLNDGYTKIYSGFKILTDPVISNDSISKYLTAMVIDNVSTGDNENRNSNMSLSDNINSSDSFTSILQRFINLTDNISSTDTTNLNGGNRKDLNDTIVITDNLFKQLIKLQTESIAIGDSENERLTKIFLDSISPTDSISLIRNKVVSLLDVITITDSISKSVYKIKNDSLFTGDTINHLNGKIIILTDNISVDDLFLKSVTKYKLDSLGVTEELQKQSDFTAKLYDVVITNDSMTLRIPNLPEYQNVIEYIMKIYPNVEINIGITPIKEFKFKI